MYAHPSYVQKLEIRRNEKIACTIDSYVRNKESKSVLEIGVGVGLFKKAIMKFDYAYMGVDRNQKMVDTLNACVDGSKAICATIPPIPNVLKTEKFDVVYAAFVAEHLADGVELFNFTDGLKSLLKENGLLVLIAPDVRSMGIEFWNQDYTHRYPTTERNVSCIIKETGLSIEKIIFYRGAMWTGITFLLCKIAGWFYYYRLMGWIFGRKAFFYSVYQYIKIDNMFFICRNNNE
jgi:predicted TPR repeat methyltransferase